MKLLNVGCGSTFHPDWTNIDIISTSEHVIEHNILEGLPFRNQTFDGAYCSHVLEHLEPEAGHGLLSEMARVLKPNGVVRIVVPDLEGLAKTYLSTLEAACSGERGAEERYDWMLLELLDQAVRRRSGGKMLSFLQEKGLGRDEFILSRIGQEAAAIWHRASRGAPRRSFLEKALSKKPSWFVKRARHELARSAALLLGGANARGALDEGAFRRSGEIHQWMYDRFSLGRSLRNAGFSRPSVCQAQESEIPDFNAYELDVSNGLTRKPDSLFMEGHKAQTL